MKDNYNQFPGSIIKRINHLMRCKENQMLSKLELHNSQTRILLFIMRNKGCNQKKLADHLNVSTATIAQTLKKLEDNNWVKRINDDMDRRSVKLYTTKKSDELLSSAVAIHTEVYERGLKNFTESEQELFESYLYRMANNLQD